MTEGWSVTLPIECLPIVLSLKTFVKGKEKSNHNLETSYDLKLTQLSTGKQGQVPISAKQGIQFGGAVHTPHWPQMPELQPEQMH